jgi:hypothetical protein
MDLLRLVRRLDVQDELWHHRPDRPVPRALAVKVTTA